jgi:hypothetical protein
MPKKDPLLEEISALLAAEGADGPARLERTLTDGYAHALSLEAERWRLEKRMTLVAREIGDGDQATKVRELSSLSQSLDVNAEHLERLRALLASLRRHADGVRVGSRAG